MDKPIWDIYTCDHCCEDFAVNEDKDVEICPHCDSIGFEYNYSFKEGEKVV
jgi:Zn finger protein HypA/HybF involved in hydrogenase expression